MLLLLARHGNTFEPGQTPVFVGAKEDLPLSKKGVQQACAIANALSVSRCKLDRIISGPLQRTLKGAEIIAKMCDFESAIEIDSRLREIDYGSWGGKTDTEIINIWGQKALDDWRERSIAPKSVTWFPKPEHIRKNVFEFTQSLRDSQRSDSTILVVTSNGILRYFHSQLAPKNAGMSDSKVNTGHVCAARITNEQTEILFWNESPLVGFNELTL